MKTILKYGQAIQARNAGRIAGVEASCKLHQTAVAAMRDGYRLAAYERTTSQTGLTIIQRKKGN